MSQHDDLDPARGIVIAVSASLAFWACLLFFFLHWKS